MFTTTTPWTNYFFAIVPILICYYAFVIFKFYRQPLLARFKQLPVYHSKITTSQPNKMATEIIAEKTNDTQAEDTPAAPDPVLMDKTEELVFEMKDQLSKTSKAEENRDAILTLVQKLFGAYTELRGTPYQLTVNEWLKNEWEESGLTRLSEEELSVVWEVS